jgi:hypothetical protein
MKGRNSVWCPSNPHAFPFCGWAGVGIFCSQSEADGPPIWELSDYTPSHRAFFAIKMGIAMPTESESQEIGREAENIFRVMMSPRHWVEHKIPQEKDFGIDFRIEKKHLGKLTGLEFLVQVKGSRELPRGDIKLSFSTGTLLYYKAKMLPILLVAVDCGKREAFFTWFDKNMVIDGDRKTHTICIPRTNLMSDEKLIISIPEYLTEWINICQNKQRNQFHIWLYDISHGMIVVLSQVYEYLLFSGSGEQDREKFIESAILGYATMFQTFISELVHYTRNIRFNDNDIDTRLHDIIKKLFNVWSTITSVPVCDIDGYEVFIIDYAKIAPTMPRVRVILWQISEVLRGPVLSMGKDT